MPYPSPMIGAYLGVQSFKRALLNVSTDRDDVVLRHLVAASRAFERDCQRYFFPYVTTNLYRWPQFAPQASWSLWTQQDLLSVTTLQVAATGQNASPIALTHYYLEPQEYGPPYSRIEVDLSYNDVFQSGPTPQRSVSVAGMWGFCNSTIPCGTLTSGLAALTTATAAIVSDSTQTDVGDVILIDSEALYVLAIPSTNNLTLQRGVNGTTAALHANSTQMYKYVPPIQVQNVVMADAISTYEQERAGWARTVGSGDLAAPFQAKAQMDYRLSVIEQFERVRSYAI